MATRKKKAAPVEPPKALGWWRVPIKCYGVYADNISVCVPMWDKKRYPNRVFLYYKKDMPPELWAVIKNGMTFYGEIPMSCDTQLEFQVRKVEVPNGEKATQS